MKRDDRVTTLHEFGACWTAAYLLPGMPMQVSPFYIGGINGATM